MPQLNDVKDTMADLADVHHVPRAISAGNFLLYGYTKKPAEFRMLTTLLMQLVKEGIIADKELEEAYESVC